MNRTRVLIVCPWFYAGDAVGAAARSTFTALAARADMSVSAIWTVNDYKDVTGVEVHALADLLLEPSFLAADVIIYVFAVYHPFFDAILIGNGHARQIVRFHNVTPKRFMPEKHWAVIEKSFAQMQVFRRADEIWADSLENLEELQRQRIEGPEIRIIPLAVSFPVRAALASKATDCMTLLYVGRFFESKGVLELILAASRLRSLTDIPFRLLLIGNIRFSDPQYIERIQALIRDLDATRYIEFRGTQSIAELAQAYQQAHIFVTASRHEGFCVPVVECLAAGCLPVSYALTNLRYIANGLGRQVHDDTADSLADTLHETIASIKHALDGISTPIIVDAGAFDLDQYDRIATAYVEDFTPEAFGDRIYARVTALVSERRPQGFLKAI